MYLLPVAGYLFFKVPLSPYFLSLAFLKSTNFKDRRQQQAAGLEAEGVRHLSWDAACGCCFTLPCICDTSTHCWPGFASGDADLNPDSSTP